MSCIFLGLPVRKLMHLHVHGAKLAKVAVHLQTRWPGSTYIYLDGPAASETGLSRAPEASYL
jgi:hypothetical protein